MSWEHRHDLHTQNPRVWELGWWKGKYICTQSSASLAGVECHQSPYILEPRRVSRGIKGSQRAEEQVAVCSANTMGQWRGSWIQSWGEGWEGELLGWITPTSFRNSRPFPPALLPPHCAVPILLRALTPPPSMSLTVLWKLEVMVGKSPTRVMTDWNHN